MTERYAWSQRFLHWLIALMIVALFVAGSIMSDIGFGRDVSPADAALRDQLYATHKLSGVTLILLVLIRFGLRLVYGAPPPLELPTLQRLAAAVSHWTLYGLMIAVPVIGWLAVSAGGFTTLQPLFDASLPSLIDRDRELTEPLFELHEALATALVAVAALHALAGLHHLFRGDGVFQRIWFGSRAA